MTSDADTSKTGIRVVPVDRGTWRDVTRLEVKADQQTFVAPPAYYLALCCYEGVWQPLAFLLEDQVVGFCMWGVDSEDSSCWLGGILIDGNQQRKGYGTRAIQATLALLNESHSYTHFALSYEPENVTAKRVYASIGFIETSEYEDGEVVARLVLSS